MIIIMHIYNWYHSTTTGIHLYIHGHRLCTWRIPLDLLSPLAGSLCSPCSPFSPFRSPSLTWNPPSCDRIRPPWSPFACKLTSPFPFPCSYTPNSKILTPRGFSPPNIHSLGWHREPASQDPVQVRRRGLEKKPDLVWQSLLHDDP
jgi:hypothetical protein